MYYPTRDIYVTVSKLPTQPQDVVFHEDKEKHEKLMAWFFKSPQPSKGIVVQFHGNAQNISSHFYSMYWVLDKGYDLFIFDYPGYGGSYGSPNPQNTVGSGLKALKYVQSRWPGKNIIVVGQSIGGAIAQRTVADLQDRKGLCALVIESSFDSYQKVAQEILSNQWWTWPFQWLPYLVLSDKYAPHGRVHEISPLPVLFIHRKQDPIVHSQFLPRLHEQARDPKKKILLEGKGHINAFTANDKEKNQSLFLDFIKGC